MHRDWCGLNCAYCDGCALDESIPCSPDCESLSLDGECLDRECLDCDAVKID